MKMSHMVKILEPKMQKVCFGCFQDAISTKANGERAKSSQKSLAQNLNQESSRYEDPEHQHDFDLIRQMNDKKKFTWLQAAKHYMQ